MLSGVKSLFRYLNNIGLCSITKRHLILNGLLGYSWCTHIRDNLSYNGILGWWYSLNLFYYSSWLDRRGNYRCISGVSNPIIGDNNS